MIMIGVILYRNYKNEYGCEKIKLDFLVISFNVRFKIILFFIFIAFIENSSKSYLSISSIILI